MDTNINLKLLLFPTTSQGQTDINKKYHHLEDSSLLVVLPWDILLAVTMKWRHILVRNSANLLRIGRVEERVTFLDGDFKILVLPVLSSRPLVSGNEICNAVWFVQPASQLRARSLIRQSASWRQIYDIF